MWWWQWELDNSELCLTQQWAHWHVARIISSQKIYALYGIEHHVVEMRGGVTDAGRTNDKQQQLKIELLSQWKLESRNITEFTLGLHQAFKNRCSFSNSQQFFSHFSPNFSVFYRTQVSLGSDLWVRFSLTHWDTFCKLNWCDSGWWRYQLNTGW